MKIRDKSERWNSSRPARISSRGGKLADAAFRVAMRGSFLLLLSVGVLYAAGPAAQPKPQAKPAARNTCLECHSKLDAPLGVTPAQYQTDIHTQKGLTCTSCHGGDASSDDMDKSMSPAAGYHEIDRAQIPALCAKCHANAAYMRGYNPSLRTDQYSQYQTSVHGKLLAKGDTHVAVCTDCHSAHGILPPNDPRSSVYPLNVAATCSHCHANAEYMKPYKIPTNQYAQYSMSVHHTALTVQGDLSAPTCSTCHGSHGAAPPGVKSVENVCSTCHAFQQQMFDSGPHKDAFVQLGLPGCITCHGNHEIAQPSDALIGTGTESFCVKCHSDGEPAFTDAAKMHDDLVKLSDAIVRSRDILNRAETAGVEVGEAQLELSGAQDDLTKARVSIHTVELAKVDENIQAGLKVTAKTYQEGLAAMAELRYRRTGLYVALIAIALVLVALAFLIRKLEAPNQG